MDNDLFVDILRILRMEFIKNGYDITDYLIGISELPRLQMLVMFCSSNEVSCEYWTLKNNYHIFIIKVFIFINVTVYTIFTTLINHSVYCY